MGISDLSYTGLDEDKDFSGLFENVAGAGLIYSLPEADLKKFYVPAIVLGGSGKDFHKYTERLGAPLQFRYPSGSLHSVDRKTVGLTGENGAL